MGKRQDSAQKTRASIIAASESLISERGIDRVTIADIAARAGVSVGSFYTYFNRKEDVVTEIANSRFGGIMQSASTENDVASALTGFLMGSIRYIASMGVPMCRSWIISSLSSDVVPGIPGGAKLDIDTGFIASQFSERGIEVDQSVPMTISRFYYGIVMCWAFTDGTSDPISEMDAFCRGPLRGILREAGISVRAVRRTSISLSAPPAHMAGYKLKLSVRGTRPALTRTVMVPDTYTLADLHRLILRAMGWSDFHLHVFEIGYSTIGPEGSDLMNVDPDLTEEKVRLSDIRGNAFEYIYDFGDDWHVKVSWLKGDDSYDKPYATYVKGTGADPPEDCGGAYAYNRIVEAVSDPEDPEHERMVEMFGDMRYDPDEVAYRVRSCPFRGSSSRAAG